MKLKCQQWYFNLRLTDIGMWTFIDFLGPTVLLFKFWHYSYSFDVLLAPKYLHSSRPHLLLLVFIMSCHHLASSLCWYFCARCCYDNFFHSNCQSWRLRINKRRRNDNKHTPQLPFRQSGTRAKVEETSSQIKFAEERQSVPLQHSHTHTQSQ